MHCYNPNFCWFNNFFLWVYLIQLYFSWKLEFFTSNFVTFCFGFLFFPLYSILGFSLVLSLMHWQDILYLIEKDFYRQKYRENIIKNFDKQISNIWSVIWQVYQVLDAKNEKKISHPRQIKVISSNFSLLQISFALSIF